MHNDDFLLNHMTQADVNVTRVWLIAVMELKRERISRMFIESRNI